jgi:hypothetical protein
MLCCPRKMRSEKASPPPLLPSSANLMIGIPISPPYLTTTTPSQMIKDASTPSSKTYNPSSWSWPPQHREPHMDNTHVDPPLDTSAVGAKVDVLQSMTTLTTHCHGSIVVSNFFEPPVPRDRRAVVLPSGAQPRHPSLDMLHRARQLLLQAPDVQQSTRESCATSTLMARLTTKLTSCTSGSPTTTNSLSLSRS